MAEQQAVTRPERYRMAMRRWAPFLWREPNGLLAGSGWFLLTCLPLVTYGPATLALTRYMRMRERGIKVTWRQACDFAFRRCGAKAWLMGLSDFAALFMALGCLIGVLEMSGAMAVRFIYSMLFMLDILYLFSGLYRYPALNAEPDSRLTLLIARGFLMGIGNLGWTMMFMSCQLLALLICAVTGVGVLILFPAASSLLSACAYDEMVKQYLPDTQTTEEEDQ